MVLIYFSWLSKDWCIFNLVRLFWFKICDIKKKHRILITSQMWHYIPQVTTCERTPDISLSHFRQIKKKNKGIPVLYNLQKANKYSQNTKLWQEKQRLTSRPSGAVVLAFWRSGKRTTQEMKVVCRAAPFPAGPDALAKQGGLLSRLCHLRCALASRLHCELVFCLYSLRIDVQETRIWNISYSFRVKEDFLLTSQYLTIH